MTYVTTLTALLFQVSESFFEVEALMEKMKQLQECREEEEASQEEMASRFEIEKRESMFVFSSGKSKDYIVNVYFKKSPIFKDSLNKFFLLEYS